MFKVTHPDCCGKAYPRVEGKPVYRDATALEYLTRLLLCNELLGDEIRLEQVMIDPAGAFRIVTSQPLIVGKHPTDRNIHRGLAAMGFEPMEAVGKVPTTTDWYRAADSVLLFDAHHGNLIQTEAGVVVPIDLFVERVG